ncbi:tripartite tricarboxylate transporter substrate binding protein [Pelagimonas varians]|uniref:Tripartite tricarboxylate transporter family receptor n=1 Tax=Pelagimonas varians TaxID=696760 RepID=A0A238K978_9RHOB|nr:tripartite tricarboxylate transporter substrate binding protein [Pelagimonas varians]PYG31029.1 tripartite-type tricarboxylate transporter receptor subunit TctC [Pelagimonas varians]SMX39471.1 Tripartite tricarboxylate transporter family receptor [Pelagimonas varians]
MIKSSLKKLAVAAGFAAALLPSAALAEYPEKPITMVIPFGAGGSHDLNARVITSIIPTYLEQAMIVRLTPGAGGQKGTQEVANAAADGYTLLFTHNYVDMLQQYVENLPYDPLEDFIPIARVNYAPIGVVVRADSPYQTFEELVAAAEKDPGGIRMSHSGNWGALFVPAAQIMKERGISLNLVPYKGGGPAMQALLSGDADVTMGFPSTLGSQIESGTVRVLATAGAERMFDDVPTFAEVGVEGDVGFMHRVLVAPKGTPDEVVAKLTTAFEALVEDKTFVRMMGRLNETIDLVDGPGYQKMREDQAVAYKELVDALTK